MEMRLERNNPVSLSPLGEAWLARQSEWQAKFGGSKPSPKILSELLKRLILTQANI